MMSEKPKQPIGFVPTNKPKENLPEEAQPGQHPVFAPDDPQNHPRFKEWLDECMGLSKAQGGLNRSFPPAPFHFWLKQKEKYEEQQAAERRKYMKGHQHSKLLAHRWENRWNYTLIPYEFTLIFTLLETTDLKASLRVVCLLPEHVLHQTVEVPSSNPNGKPTEVKTFNEPLAFRLKLAVENRITPKLLNYVELPSHDWFLLEAEWAIADEVDDLNIPVCRVSVFPKPIEPEKPNPLSGVHIGE